MKSTKIVLTIVALFVILGAGAAPALAQEPEAAPGYVEKSFFETYIAAGGWCGWIIVGCSFVMLALTIECAVNIRREKLVPPQLVDEIEGMLENEEYQEALELCESEPNYLTNMLAAALPKINHGFDEMKSAAAGIGEQEATKLNQHIGWIALIGAVAPMLGLYGTVIGMIAAFQIIVKLGSAVTPAYLADGIAVALVTTFLGLSVAIPAAICHFWIKLRTIRAIVEIQNISDELLERFRGK
jgi:biopolymer transport protein ExbB